MNRKAQAIALDVRGRQSKGAPLTTGIFIDSCPLSYSSEGQPEHVLSFSELLQRQQEQSRPDMLTSFPASTYMVEMGDFFVRIRSKNKPSYGALHGEERYSQPCLRCRRYVPFHQNILFHRHSVINAERTYSTVA